MNVRKYDSARNEIIVEAVKIQAGVRDGPKFGCKYEEGNYTST